MSLAVSVAVAGPRARSSSASTASGDFFALTSPPEVWVESSVDAFASGRALHALDAKPAISKTANARQFISGLFVHVGRRQHLIGHWMCQRQPHKAEEAAQRRPLLRITPRVGLEPTTTRLTVERSTN